MKRTAAPMLCPMKVLVTGGAGYIGSHLVDLLVARGDEVLALDDLSTGKAKNVAGHVESGAVELIHDSILEESVVDDAVSRCEIVFHLAAAVGVRMIVEEPLRSLLVNTRGTEIVLGAASRHGSRLVLASTSEVYGKTGKVPFFEDDDRVLGPTTVHRWGYSTAKAFDEHLALAYADQGLAVSIVRYFNSYGPRLDPRGYGSVVANFIRQALAGNDLTVHGDGKQSRCFTYISDTVSGTLSAGIRNEALGKVINLGTTIETSVSELAILVRDKLGSNSEIVEMPYESYYGPGFEDTRRRVPDISRAAELLDWQPEVDLDEGLERTISWWKETHA